MGALVAEGLVDPALAGTDEQVLVLPEAGELSVALYLSDAVQRTLGTGLQSHCHATEGVSHVLLLLWSAARGRPLRMLDLELQAEVDKACTCLLLDRSSTGGRGGRALLRRLFDDVRFAAHLDDAERSRYREAHRLASGYAGRLHDLLERGVEDLLAELRGFYRLPAEAKRAHAARAA